MLHHCSALIGNPLRSYFSGHELHLFLCSTWQYYTCRVSFLIITWKTSFHNFEVCEQWKGGKAWSYNPLRYRFFSTETANKKEKYLIFWTIPQTRRNVYQMQSSFKRILAVLGLPVSLRVVKDGRWQEKTVADIETDGFSSQPANSSPARDPSNCADPKLPVTHSCFHPHFPDVPREVPLQIPCAMVLSSQPHLQKCLLQFLSSRGVPAQQHHASLLTLHKSRLLLRMEHWSDPQCQK